MKNFLKISAFCVLLLLPVVAIFGFFFYLVSHQGAGTTSSGATQTQPEAAQVESPVAQPQTARPTGGIVIKGLYIGMDFQDVPAVVAQKFGASWKVKSEFGQDCAIMNPGLEQLRKGYDQYHLSHPLADTEVRLRFDEAGKLFYVKIGRDASHELFSSGNLSAEEFAKTFLNSYNIPNLDGGNGGWSYASPDNVKIAISTEKEVEIWKGADLKAARTGFN